VVQQPDLLAVLRVPDVHTRLFARSELKCGGGELGERNY